jgi:hypothetical protein
MAYASINKSSDFFNTKLYTGDGSARSITGVGFQPDMVWTKVRSTTDNHNLQDSVRGVQKSLYPDLTLAEAADAQALTSYDSDGYSIGTQGNMNANSQTFVSWNWKANGAASLNEVGSINSTVSVNTTAGFSIVKYTGTGSAATVGHGLGVAPELVIIKKMDSASSSDWMVYQQAISGTGNGHIWLNLTNDRGTDTNSWNNTATTSTVFSIGNRLENNSSGDIFIAYCFSPVKGYSSFKSYTGNGNADGTFVYTGFKPAFLIIKRYDTTKNWYLHDSKRDGYNNDNPYLSPNITAAETGGTELDLLSNGFKMTSSGTGHNASGGSYLYIAFAENPLVANVGQSIPATAR